MVFSDANQPLIKGVSFIYVPHHHTNTHTDSLNTIFPLDFLPYLLPSPFLPPKPGSGWSGLLILGSEVLGVVTGLPPLHLTVASCGIMLQKTSQHPHTRCTQGMFLPSKFGVNRYSSTHPSPCKSVGCHSNPVHTVVTGRPVTKHTCSRCVLR